jgi:formylglycine-generating enzyme required for sulfatase activity
MTDVFISYSRRNLDFVHKLDVALSAQGKLSWFDQKKQPLEGLPPGSKWWEEIKHGIETADNFLFVISPESVTSPYCNAEIAHALYHERRIVTVLYRQSTGEADTLRAIDHIIDSIPDNSELPSSVSATITNLRSLTRRNWLEISKVQYVVFSDEETFDQSIALLVQGLDMDLAWIRTWSQVRQTARIWKETSDDSYLWSEMRLKPVREMVEQRAQELTDIEREFIRPEAERLLAELDNIDTTHARRSDIGERLCAIGDPRPGVGLRPDGLPDIVWCYVDEPEDRRGKKIEFIDHKGKLGDFEIKPFYIAKYPITFVQFQAFLDDPDGFGCDKWWKGLYEKYRKQEMADQHFKFANHPRENLSWYQAVAFCQWLSAKLPLDGWANTLSVSSEAETGIRTDWKIRLPTEWEWQYAATSGSPTDDYPWGPDWEEGRHCNTKDSGLSRTTAVGMYPHGVSTTGVMDLLGNVWEWCLNKYSKPNNTEIASAARRVLRGGAWNLNPNFARCVYRNSNEPYSIYNNRGFRVVCAAPI